MFMSLIDVSHLTFSYDGMHQYIFNDVSFKIDTNWRLGFCGRNGRGKTTFLKLLMNEYEYKGNIYSNEDFSYFPYEVSDPQKNTIDVLEQILSQTELWRIECELNQLQVLCDCLYRPFNSLSNGEQTKIQLAALFLKDNNFLLIDEPTNHLDTHGRKILSDYLRKKRGYIVVSHDRAFLDNCVDHILSINKSNIEIVSGNFSSWYQNKELNDAYETEKNEHLKHEIKRLNETAREKAIWSDRVEATKIGTHQADRGRIGHLAAKMMKRSKAIQKRKETEIHEKSKLLKNIESAEPLKISPLEYHSKRIMSLNDVSISYNGTVVFDHVTFDVNQKDRISIEGKNGTGKTSIIKLIMGENITCTGGIIIPDNLIFSYIPQDMSCLAGSLSSFIENEKIDETLFKTILRKLDFSRDQFDKEISSYSDGQKKKVLIASSLSKRANVYLWDEPLNFVDVISRVQIEELIIHYMPTLIFVEHDSAFCHKVATKHIDLSRTK